MELQFSNYCSCSKINKICTHTHTEKTWPGAADKVSQLTCTRPSPGLRLVKTLFSSFRFGISCSTCVKNQNVIKGIPWPSPISSCLHPPCAFNTLFSFFWCLQATGDKYRQTRMVGSSQVVPTLCLCKPLGQIQTWTVPVRKPLPHSTLHSVNITSSVILFPT